MTARKRVAPTKVLAKIKSLLGERSPETDAYGRNATSRVKGLRTESPIFIETVEESVGESLR